MVQQLGQDEADVLLLACQRSVLVAVVFLLITQREDGRQRVQLGSDVRIQDVRVVFCVCVRTVSISLQELQEAPGLDVRKTAMLGPQKKSAETSGSAQVRRAKVELEISWQLKQKNQHLLLLSAA